MPEQLKIKTNLKDPVYQFLSDAIDIKSDTHVGILMDLYRSEDPVVDIEFKINGVELPFLETLRKIYARMDARLEEIKKTHVQSIPVLESTVALLDKFVNEFQNHINDEIDPIRFYDEN